MIDLLNECRREWREAITSEAEEELLKVCYLFMNHHISAERMLDLFSKSCPKAICHLIIFGVMSISQPDDPEEPNDVESPTGTVDRYPLR